MSIFKDEKFDTMFAFEDEVDVAISAEDLAKAEKEIEDNRKKYGNLHESSNENMEEFLDDNLDSDDILDPDFVYDKDHDVIGTAIEDIDADKLIAADRDLMKDPFEEDDLIDAATGNDIPDDLTEDEDDII